ncbi:hypothetical protein SERLADRAFT_377536 [Serpula lacrymans var. lacrymans S7.9]|uniref:Uncharacterized protein n=1 Tax=Serpula lacrymans var. lacrymans (strain S7.9) TaxID=578457 RepID=F8NGP0_SERL9|nr:uncharacterized protein SERLADRAFT_377536 [Serpula lacrymans var. lacrymans S7.9]EGO29122.1 hypothetical protein SERLADRAFT_377536 [Serpula lacrymans var. lacrymans S7.9]
MKAEGILVELVVEMVRVRSDRKAPRIASEGILKKPSSATPAKFRLRWLSRGKAAMKDNVLTAEEVLE